MEDCAMTTVRAQAPLVRGYMAMLPKALVSLMQEARCRDKEFWPDDYKLVDIAKRMCDKYDAMIPPEIAVQPKHVEEEDFTAKEYPYRACKILRGFLGERTIQLHVPQPETAFYDDKYRTTTPLEDFSGVRNEVPVALKLDDENLEALEDLLSYTIWSFREGLPILVPHLHAL
ncbi:uncharacterized protein LOC9646593 [Selaginella moellendorffii]|uniref:uncharacterized protein LOC9646593 n=1 Tax=Selaginella moellendorffii TaxID=88036 RepID=UPI000D1C2861|nr:uncharacterized protein LOC9646593 [Selaginella moellendorffii]|eukprot:XP_024531032.1 uncharacterized protein LOC9646593 [Selaginella moellendorffii]